MKVLIFIFLFVLVLPDQVYSIDINDGKRPTVGLVLSGGGAKGLAHIGVLKVLEEAGMPIDFIGGTSMGSIVAGFYAMGYSAKEIEEITLAQDWISLLTDKLERTNLSVKESEDYDKYLISFPFEKYKFKMPSGFGAGQNISMLLSRLALPVADISDFNNLPIPYLCVATDIVTGEEVVLRNGYLPDAIHASMAIPTFFSPVKYNNHYLVDGGLINNFPVDHVKAMGADIIIGVNLGLKEYSQKDLENLATVLEQSLFFHAKDKNIENRKLCDILISPDVYSSSAGSFSDVAELISVGENSARKRLKDLKQLADSIKRIGQIITKIKPKPVDSLFIKEIEYQGLEKVAKSLIEGKLRLQVPSKLSVNDIEEGIERVYGSQFFRKITYKTEIIEEDSVLLVLRVEENTNDKIKLGIRYDSYFKTQLLLNITLRNKLIKGSKLALDFNLGLYPHFSAEYRINTGWKPNNKRLFKKNNLGVLPDLGLKTQYRNIVLNNYESSELISTYNFDYVTIGGFFSTSISNPLYAETGVNYNFSILNPVIKSDQNRLSNNSVDIYTEIIYDSFDDQIYPQKGTLISIWGDLIRDFNITEGPFLNTIRLGLRLEKIFPVNKFLFIQPYGQYGLSLGDSISPLNSMFLGGNINSRYIAPNLYSFSGLRFMERKDNTLYSLGCKVRVNPFKSHYLTIDNVFGRIDSSSYELFSSTNDYLYGFGVIYGYRSMFGPIEIGAYKSNQPVTWQIFFNIGYWF